jgi:hypothetical protein
MQKTGMIGVFFENRLHLSGLIREASQPDIQKIRMVGFFKNRLHLFGLIGKRSQQDMQKIRMIGFFK